MQKKSEEKRLTVTNFRDYCFECGFTNYTYDYADQDFIPELCGPLRLYAVFHSLSISLAPATVTFRGTSATLCLDRVVSVTVTPIPGSDKAAEIHVTCRSYAFPERDTVFKLRASR